MGTHDVTGPDLAFFPSYEHRFADVGEESAGAKPSLDSFLLSSCFGAYPKERLALTS